MKRGKLFYFILLTNEENPEEKPRIWDRNSSQKCRVERDDQEMSIYFRVNVSVNLFSNAIT